MRIQFPFTLVHVPLDLICLFKIFKDEDVKTWVKLAELFFLLKNAESTDFLL